MKSEITFGRWEAICFLVILTGAKIFLNFPRTITESVSTAGWILILYSTVLALILFFVISRLYKPFEGKDLIDIAEKAMGSVGRIIIGLILIGNLLFITSIILREFGEDMKTITFFMSPISYILILFIAGMITAAYFGLEAIVRIAAIAVPIIAVGYILILIGIIPYYNINNLFPILGTGINDIFVKGVSQLSMFAPLIILFLITPNIKTYKNMKRVGYITIGASCFGFVTSALVYIMVYPYPVALENFLPVYQLARLINLGRFFQRIESMFVFIWAAGALLYLSANFFLLIHVFKKTFKLKYHKPLIIPFAILVFNISFLPPSLMETIKLETVYFGNYLWIMAYGLPLIVLLAARFRNKSIKGGAKNNES